jgi:hypothetical protein
MNLENINRNKY